MAAITICSDFGNGTPLQYSCLENPMDGGAWWAAVHGVPKSQIRLSDFTFTFHFHASEKETAIHSSVLAWRIPGTGEPGELPSMGSHRVGHDWSDLAAAAVILSDHTICSLRVWLTSFSIMLLSFIHVVACISISFLLMTTCYPIMWMHHIVLIHQLMDRPLGLFPVFGHCE